MQAFGPQPRHQHLPGPSVQRARASGMVIAKVEPGRSRSTSAIELPGADEFRRDGEAEAGTAGAHRSLEGAEEMRACPLRHAGAGVGNPMVTSCPALRRDHQAADDRGIGVAVHPHRAGRG